jgi:hypothetical protein
MTQLPQRLRKMAFAMHILDQEYLTDINGPGLAVARRYLMRGIQIDHILAAGGRVPIEEPICRSRANMIPFGKSLRYGKKRRC